MKAYRVLAAVAMGVGLAGLMAVPSDAREKQIRRQPREAAVSEIPARKPYLAVVGLREQQVVFYDAGGEPTLVSKISSGSTRYETPPGIFSIVQKNYEHYSNVYDDASMPFMQRLTWTGIALHAGVLPGYPASHGCVRLPHDFARRLFDMTEIGMRVVIAREGIVPTPVDEPALFNTAAAPTVAEGGAIQLVNISPDAGPAEGYRLTDSLQARYESLSAAARDAAQRTRDQRAGTVRAKTAAQPAIRALEQAQAALASAEAARNTAEKIIASEPAPKRMARAQKDLESAQARIEAARTTLERVRAESSAKIESARLAQDKLDTLVQEEELARHHAEQARLDMSPVSVFVSRATRRLYVRKAFHPVMEAPIIIRDADQPIGTFVFTAGEAAAGETALRWNVVSLYKNPTNIEPFAPAAKASGKQAAAAAAPLPSTDAGAAQAALARLNVPPELAAQISRIVLPGSSLIISDEPPSIETGKDTDFVVLMSGEPNGGIISRKRTPKPQELKDDGWFWGYSSASAAKPGSKKPASSTKFLWFN